MWTISGRLVPGRMWNGLCPPLGLCEGPTPCGAGAALPGRSSENTTATPKLSGEGRMRHQCPRGRVARRAGEGGSAVSRAGVLAWELADRGLSLGLGRGSGQSFTPLAVKRRSYR